jgi:hypothetical protein
MASLTYNCPSCGGAAAVAEEHVGGNVTCPHCSQEFFATPPVEAPEPVHAPKPQKVPFFKSSRLNVLREKLDALTADGDYSAEDARELFYEATRLRLSAADLDKIRLQAVQKAVASVKQRAEQTWHLTDEDVARFEAVGRAFGTTIQLDSNFHAFREIYRMEVKGELPPPLASAPFMTEPGEVVYLQSAATWAQLRVQRKGYSGVSASVPTGIRGVRLRYGTISPISREELTPLASGTLYVTDVRLFFDGDRRNTATKLAKITDFTVYRDGLEVEKATGRSDVYYMDALRARFIEALVRALRR